MPISVVTRKPWGNSVSNRKVKSSLLSREDTHSLTRGRKTRYINIYSSNWIVVVVNVFICYYVSTFFNPFSLFLFRPKLISRFWVWLRPMRIRNCCLSIWRHLSHWSLDSFHIGWSFNFTLRSNKWFIWVVNKYCCVCCLPHLLIYVELFLCMHVIILFAFRLLIF